LAGEIVKGSFYLITKMSLTVLGDLEDDTILGTHIKADHDAA
jgi:hypothetical protein